MIRGGIGLFYNAQGSGGGLYRMHRMLPFAASTTIAVNEFVPNFRQVKDGLPPIPSTDFEMVSNNPVGNFLSIPPEYRPSHALQFNFGIQEQLRCDIVVKAAYLGNLGRHLDANYNHNQPVPGAGAIPPRRPLFGLAPGVVGLPTLRPAATPDIMRSRCRRRSASPPVSVSSRRTLIPMQSTMCRSNKAATAMAPSRRTRGIVSWTEATAAFDIRHRWTQTVLYNLPFGKGKRYSSSHGWVNTAFGDWQVNMILIWQTGLPFTPSLASPVANTGTGSRPDRLGDATIDNPDPARWFNTALGTSGAPWGTPVIYTFGNAGRGFMRGPGRTNIDVSLFKEFGITEQVRLQFRAEFFNLPDHRNSTCRTPALELQWRERSQGQSARRAIFSSDCGSFSSRRLPAALS